MIEAIQGWDAPGLRGFFEFVSFLANDNWPAMLIGATGVLFLWLLGQNKAAVAFVVVGAVVVLVAFLGDYSLGAIVDRTRPLIDGEANTNTNPSFPSGHVFGSTVMFGFWGYLGIYYRLPREILAVFLVGLASYIVAVGLSRIYLGAHWPSDVAAGYLLGVIWLMLLIPVFTRIQKVELLVRRRLKENPAVLACESCRVERSIASRVDLNPETGTATKVYRPPPVVSLIYWIAFQAKFPYTHNEAALRAAAHRRKIASFLTIHRFGKDLVAPVVTIDCSHDVCSFVTEYIPGKLAENTPDVQRFLGEVAETFSAAGLSVWQVQPSNPHAHTNLIGSPEDGYTIIDLESAVVTLMPGPGQWRSALRMGRVPVFDDIDFDRLRGYISEHREALLNALGPDGLREFEREVLHGEEAIREWKESEPRIPGRVISRIYKILALKGHAQHMMGAVQGAYVAAHNFLERGVERWQSEGKLSEAQAASLRSRASAPEARGAMHNLGVHLVIGIALPLPGVRGLFRATWSTFHWIESLVWRRGARDSGHGLAVIGLSLVPVLGAASYAVSRPLRGRQMARLMLAGGRQDAVPPLRQAPSPQVALP